MHRQDASRRYKRGIVIASTVYGVSLFGGSAWFGRHPGSANVVAYAMALVPGVSITMIFVVIGRYLTEEGDEYLRMLRIRQALIASAVAMSVSTIWGFLESFDLAPHLASFWVAVIWFAGFALGAMVNRVFENR